MPISTLPAAPQRTDPPETFSTRADAFVSALSTFVTEANGLQTDVANKQALVAADYAAAVAAGLQNAATNATSASASASNAAASASAASTSQTTAATNASTATTKASEASASAAAAASSVLGQTTSKVDLSVIDQSVLASTTLVDAVIYDTSKDSDGGAWRKRCQDKSWFTETIYGKWLGSAASEAAARAISGATTNDYYYDTTAAKFYALNVTSGRTEVFRGNGREFPARALITAESARVVIWDLTQPGCPMFLVVVQTNSPTITYNFWRGSRNASSVAALNGVIYFGTNSVSDSGLCFISFPTDNIGRYHADVAYGGNGALVVARNAASDLPRRLSAAIVSHLVNDVALTVLPDAPIDPATGLPVPTIAVATDGGVSVIKQDGTVVNSAATQSFDDVTFNDTNELCYLGNAAGNRHANISAPVGALLAGWAYNRRYIDTTVPAARNPSLTLARTLNGSRIAVGHNSGTATDGLSVFRENPASPTLGMVAYSTIAYASGWLPGDIRGAFITAADGVTETIAASGELVTNGTFDTDLTGWAADAGTTAEWDAGSMKVTRTSLAKVRQTITLAIGKTYVISVTMTSGTGVGRLAMNGSDFLSASGVAQFTPTEASNQIELRSSADGTYCWFDNVSVKLAIADRSVKNNGLIVNGSLSKAPVAAGAGLCALSGFSAANYLEQPYSANLDFGTGDFCVMGWVKLPLDSTERWIFQRDDIAAPFGGDEFGLFQSNANALTARFGVGKSVSAASAPSAWGFFTIFRSAGIGYFYLNAGLVGSVAAAQSITNLTAVLRIGLAATGGAPFGTGALALFRISATPPSADQIRHIFETEKKLFEPNAQCALAGTSNAITALAYDDETDLLHVGTSWGRSAFQGLTRVSSEATPVGSIKALAASGGAVAQVGASSVDIYLPAYSLREEMERLDDAAKALGCRPVFHEFDAVTSQVGFVVPMGFRAVAVYSAGTLKRIGSTKDYTVLNDGFRETVRFAVAPGNAVWVSIMTVRSN